MLGLQMLLWATLAVAPTPPSGPTVIQHAEVHDGRGHVLSDATVVMRNGRIAAVQTGEVAVPADAQVIDAKGQWLTPGLIGADTTLGLIEISLEDSTSDVGIDDDDPIHAAYDPAWAINTASSLIGVQAIDGMTSALVAPTGGLISGQATWLDLWEGRQDMIADSGLAIAAGFGNQVYGGSRAAALAKFVETLDDAAFYRTHKSNFDRGQSRDLAAHRRDLEALIPLLNGDIPLLARAHRVSDMLALVEIAKQYGFALVIIGGAQAWQIADELANAKATVIVQPSNNLPQSFDVFGARMDNAALLEAAGVNVGIAVLFDAHNQRNVTQEAGLAIAHGMDHEAALSAVTYRIAHAYNMSDDYGSIEVGKRANLVLWPGDPFEIVNVPTAVWIRGEAMPMESRQTRLRDRYIDRLNLADKRR